MNDMNSCSRKIKKRWPYSLSWYVEVYATIKAINVSNKNSKFRKLNTHSYRDSVWIQDCINVTINLQQTLQATESNNLLPLSGRNLLTFYSCPVKRNSIKQYQVYLISRMHISYIPRDFVRPNQHIC